MESENRRKLFISFLGTNNYIQTYYQFANGEKSGYVRFIQEALIDKICTEWTEEDKICIFCTETSQNVNWENDGQKNISDEIERIGLKQILTNKNNLRAKVVMEIIPEGFNAEEIWKIFETVDAQVLENDEIYFDVTHAFRSIPIFTTTLLHYLSFMKHTKIASLNYGAFEKLGPAFEVRKLKPEQRIAPVLDLMEFIELQDWTFAAANLRENGKVGSLSRCLNDYIKDHPNIKRGPIATVSSSMLSFEQNIATCCGIQIKNATELDVVNKNLKSLGKQPLPTPLKTIISAILGMLNPFTPNSFNNLQEAIKWCLRYGLIQQAYTLTQETLVTYLCDKFKDLNLNKKNNPERQYRDYISALLGISDSDKENIWKWSYTLSSCFQLTEAFFKLEWFDDLRQNYNRLKDKRNVMNHGGFTNKTEKGKDIIANAEKFVGACLEFLNKDLERPQFTKNTTYTFINLSNHPSSTWDEKQLAAAREYGEVEDMEFPIISPDADAKDIDKLAHETAQKIIEKARTSNVTVHVMGEMTFTFALVTILEAFGIRCVASTTYRVVNTLPDGVKQVKFDFIKFREYKYRKDGEE